MFDLHILWMSRYNNISLNFHGHVLTVYQICFSSITISYVNQNPIIYDRPPVFRIFYQRFHVIYHTFVQKICTTYKYTFSTARENKISRLKRTFTNIFFRIWGNLFTIFKETYLKNHLFTEELPQYLSHNWTKRILVN